MPTFTLTPDLAMGKDRSKDGDAATSSTKNKDHSQDQEFMDAMLARTITVAVAGALAQQKSEETQSIAKAVAGALAKQKAEETQSITEAFTRQMEKTYAQYEKLLKETCHQPCLQPLKLLQVQTVLESWTPLTGQWTKISTRDGSYGHTRLDLH